MPYLIEEFDHWPHEIPDASESSDGVMSAADKIKLDSLTPGGGIGAVVVWAQATPWATIYAIIATAAAAGNGVIVMLNDDDSGNLWEVPAGNYNLDNVIFDGSTSTGTAGGGGIINFQAGATITGKILSIRYWVTVLTNGQIFSGDTFFAVCAGDSGIDHNGGATPFVITAGGVGLVVYGLDAFFNGFGVGAELFRLNDTVTAFFTSVRGFVGNYTVGRIGGTPTLEFHWDETSEIGPISFAAGITISSIENNNLDNSFTGNGAITITSVQLIATSVFTILANGNVASIGMPVPHNGQRLVLLLQQNAAGTASWPSVIGNMKLPGGSITKTLTANAVDKLNAIGLGGIWYADVFAADLK